MPRYENIKNYEIFTANRARLIAWESTRSSLAKCSSTKLPWSAFSFEFIELSIEMLRATQWREEIAASFDIASYRITKVNWISMPFTTLASTCPPQHHHSTPHFLLLQLPFPILITIWVKYPSLVSISNFSEVEGFHFIENLSWRRWPTVEHGAWVCSSFFSHCWFSWYLRIDFSHLKKITTWWGSSFQSTCIRLSY